MDAGQLTNGGAGRPFTRGFHLSRVVITSVAILYSGTGGVYVLHTYAYACIKGDLICPISGNKRIISILLIISYSENNVLFFVLKMQVNFNQMQFYLYIVI